MGRILRVDRRLQIVKDLPTGEATTVMFFCPTMQGETGLNSAAQRINAVKTEG